MFSGPFPNKVLIFYMKQYESETRFMKYNISTTAVTALSETRVLDEEGNLKTLEALVEGGAHSASVYSITRNRHVHSSRISDLDYSLDTDSRSVMSILLTTGEVMECMLGDRILSDDNNWVVVSDLTVGDAIKVMVYNPAHRHPQTAFRQVASLSLIEAPLIELASFRISDSDNVLVVARSSQEVDMPTMVPVKFTAA